MLQEKPLRLGCSPKHTSLKRLTLTSKYAWLNLKSLLSVDCGAWKSVMVLVALLWV